MNQNYFEPNSNSSSFDQPPQYSINHQPRSIQKDLNQQKMNDEFKIELRNELLNTIQSLYERILQREQAANVSTHTHEPSRRFNIIYDYDDDDDDMGRCDVRRLASSFLVFCVLCFMSRIASDFKYSRARGFVYRSLDLQSLACLLMGIRYPRSY
ncbi:hypothetical protein Tco_0929909 [Tanacetum coccineum]